MSENKSRVVGSLVQWDGITTNTPETATIPPSEHDYTVEDLYVLLKELRDLFRPEHMEYVEGLITKHVNDYNNPHRTDLTKMGTSVLQELYNLWLANGHTGTREEFLKVLFQYVKIADMSTTLAGTARDQVPSVKGVAAVVAQHNVDPDAHDSLFATFFPGEELTYPPTYAIEALLGLPRTAVVKRASTITYIDATGTLKVAAENTLPTDFMFGKGMFPLFGDLTNEFLVSEDMTNPYWQKSNGSFELLTGILTPRRDEYAFGFREASTENPVEHVITPSAGVTVGAGEVWAINLFVAPMARPCFGIRVPEVFGGPYAYAHFDLTTGESFINDAANPANIAVRMKKLASGMTRICLFVKTLIAGTLLPEFYPIDILSGDANYSGSGELATAMFGLQMTRCNELPPYIPSLGTKGSIAATKLTIPLDDWYNPNVGTFVFESSNVIPLHSLTSKDLYAVATDVTQIALSGRFPITHNKKFYFTAYNNLNNNFFSKWSESCERDFVTLVHGYSATKQLVGFYEGDPIETATTQAANQNCSKLYLGTNRYGSNPFNGWLRRVMYYPQLVTIDNAHFLLGE